jgi:predicted DsbA family dithiol-disulfide isomerase
VTAVADASAEPLREALGAWRRGAKPGCELAVALDPARDRLVGDPGATIDVIEYLGYGSAAGARADRAARAALRPLLTSGRICFAWRHFPLIDAHPHAFTAARAVEAAERQGGFWALHEALSQALAERWPGPPSQREIVELARGRGLDPVALGREMADPEIAERIVSDFEGGARSGVNGSPTFYVAGIRQIFADPGPLVARIERALDGDWDALWPPRSAPPRS